MYVDKTAESETRANENSYFGIFRGKFAGLFVPI